LPGRRGEGPPGLTMSRHREGGRRTPGGPSAILLDFDHTLLDTDRFFWVDLRAAAVGCVIDPGEWETSYAEVWPTGYSLEKHLNVLARRGEVAGAAVAEMRRVLRESFGDLRAYLFADVEPFLRRLRAQRVPCFLVSFGDPAWQAYKVQGAGLSPFFQEIFFTGRVQAKAEVVGTLVGRFDRLVVVDNDPRELDRITADFPPVDTFWISRVPADALSGTDAELRERFREARGYATLPTQFPHRRCCTLDEVAL
jgi:phosphoglycolate phosphatase-like HAD superfamily hydrolase